MPGAQLPRELTDELGHEPRVPEVDGALLGHLAHALSVGAHAVEHDRAARRRWEPVVARGDPEPMRWVGCGSISAVPGPLLHD
jgi:hypothetical protein